MPTASLMPSSFKSIFLALCVTFLAAGIARAQETETEIDYTGSLFGYYRIEPVSGPPRLAPVSEFIKARNQQQGHLLLGMGDNFGPEFGALLQLENKRVHDQDFDCHQIPTVRQDKETIPESLYKDDDRIARHAQCDNVLNFMMQAGFRAVVPGRQDFMYTARWLRGAARLIADASSQPNGSPLISNADKQLYILGANLRLSIKNDMALIQAGGDGGTYKVSKRCPLLFSKSPFGADTPQCGLDGKQSAAFDWLDRLDRLGRLEGNSNDADYRTVTAIQQLAAASVGTAPGKPSALATLVRDEVEIMLAAWGKRADLSALSGLPALIESGKNKVTLDTLSEALDNGKSALKKMEGCPATYPSGLLSTQAPTDYEDLCRYKDDLEKVLDNFKTSMGREPDRNANFMVSDDARKAAIRGLLRTIAIEQKDVGYTIVNPDTNRKILVIGVVGQETMKAVSATNLHLCGAVQADSTWPADFADCHEARKGEAPRNRITASVEVVDPVLATEALIRAARLQFGKFERIVVMAQMPHTDAEVLSTRVWAKLRAVHESAQVDIVLSEAQAGYDSSNITLSYAPGRIPAAKRAMVLTPVTSYSPRDGVFPGAVSRATIKSDAAQTYSIANQPGIYVPTALTGNITTVSLLLDLMTQLQGSSSTPLCANSNVEDCRVRTVMMLMESLQKAAKPRADVVLLQSRDYLLDKIEEDYTDYTMCGEGDHKDIHFNLCKLRVALDRILWKGDYIEFVAVTGKI